MSDPNDPRPPDLLARALDALEPVPPPPPVARVLAAISARAAPPRWLAPFGWASPMRLFLVCATALALVLGALVVDATRATQTSRARIEGAPFVGEILEGTPLVRRDGAGASAPATLGIGATVSAHEPARLRWGAGVEVTLDAGASLRLEGPRAISALEGRSRYEVGPDAAGPLTVRTRWVTVVDVGTRFSVDVDPLAPASSPGQTCRVTVEEGVVEANGVSVGAGWGLSFRDEHADGSPWPLDAKPSLTLEPETVPAVVGQPVVLRVVLHNPTGGWISLSEADPVRAPLWIEIEGPGGGPVPVRVTGAMLATNAPAPTAIPPRGEVGLRIRFERTFASPGTYRLRALYRPAGAVDHPASPVVSLTIR